jgi:hypothetical protein
MGASVRASLAVEASHDESSLSAYFVQKMFTTSIVLPDSPGDFFSDAFTEDMLNDQIAKGRIGPDNLPVYVSNIVWGRMMMLTMTSTEEVSKMQAALQASYQGMSGSVSGEHLEVLQNSTIKLVTVGGDAQAALDFLRTGQLGEFFKDDAPLTTAVPLSYTLRNLGDNAVAKVSETTSYDMVECSGLEAIVVQDEAAWRNQVLSGSMELLEFPTSSANVGLADEVSNPPGKNVELGGVLTWPAANTPLPFDLVLTAPEGHMTYWDDEAYGQYTISIGDIDNWQNDDFWIEVSGVDVYALAFYLGDNQDLPGEDLSVWAATEGGGEEYLQQFPQGYRGFVGLISPVPLRRIQYNEDSGGDDIYVSGLRFGVRQ